MNLSQLKEDCDCIIIKRDSFLGFPKERYLQAMNEVRASVIMDDYSPLVKLIVYLLEEAMITGYNSNSEIFKKDKNNA
jgi:hypothetical protein